MLKRMSCRHISSFTWHDNHSLKCALILPIYDLVFTFFSLPSIISIVSRLLGFLGDEWANISTLKETSIHIDNFLLWPCFPWIRRNSICFLYFFHLTCVIVVRPLITIMCTWRHIFILFRIRRKSLSPASEKLLTMQSNMGLTSQKRIRPLSVYWLQSMFLWKAYHPRGENRQTMLPSVCSSALTWLDNLTTACKLKITPLMDRTKRNEIEEIATV